MTEPADQVRLAQGYLEAGDPLQAVSLLESVREHLEGDRAVELLLAQAYFRSAQLARARGVLEPLVERDPTEVFTRFLLARTLERQGELDHAIRQLRLVTAMSDRPEYRERLETLEARRST